MKNTFRQSMAWLHTWTGLVVGWVLLFIFITGTPGYFDDEITRWMQPERPMAEPTAGAGDLAAMVRMGEWALDRLETTAPGAAQWRIVFPHDSLVPYAYDHDALRGWQDLSIQWQEMSLLGQRWGEHGGERLDPVTGAPLSISPELRATAGGEGLYEMHYALRYLGYYQSMPIIGVCTMIMLLAMISGVTTHKKIFKDFFTFRPGKGQRSWLDAHNASSVMALPFLLMITFSGLVFFADFLPSARHVLYGVSWGPPYTDELFEFDTRPHAPVSRPTAALEPLLAQAAAEWGSDHVAAITVERFDGDPLTVTIGRTAAGIGDGLHFPEQILFDASSGERLSDAAERGGTSRKIWNALTNLHEGLFVDVWGRWLFFLSGLAGCAMIATGLVLWTVKRRKHHLGSGHEAAEDFSIRLVDTLNVATIAGLPLAVAAFFWANRLLPLDMAERAEWELHTLFVVWLATLFYALARPLPRAWVELLWGVCAAWALIPVVNFLTTDRHLFNSLPAGDWVMAGFDLTAWGLATCFAVMALKVQRRLLKPSGQHGRPDAGVPAAMQERRA